MTEGNETSRLLIGRMDDLAAAVREIRTTQTDAQKAQHQIALTVERISARLEGVTEIGRRVEDIEDQMATNEVRLKILEQPGIAISNEHEQRIAKLEKLVVRAGGGIAVLIVIASIGREVLKIIYK